MSRQSRSTGPCPVNSGRDERRPDSGSLRSGLAPGNQPGTHTPYGHSSQSEQPHQLTQDTTRAWTHPNPEVDRVINDPRLNQVYPHSGSVNGSYGDGSHQSTTSYAGQHPQTYTQYSGLPQGSNGGLTVQNLYSSNYGQESSSRIDVWKGEGQRDGQWYGNVERG